LTAAAGAANGGGRNDPSPENTALPANFPDKFAWTLFLQIHQKAKTQSPIGGVATNPMSNDAVWETWADDPTAIARLRSRSRFVLDGLAPATVAALTCTQLIDRRLQRFEPNPQPDLEDLVLGLGRVIAESDRSRDIFVSILVCDVESNVLAIPSPEHRKLY
jgi:hypothetical protein